MISLGGIELNPLSEVVWSDRYVSSKVEQENSRTLGGRLIVEVGELIGGRPITLLATDRFGWIRKSKVDLLIPLADVPGAVYAFVFGAQTHSVLFDHTRGAINMRPVGPARSNDADGDDWMMGEINLLTV